MPTAKVVIHVYLKTLTYIFAAEYKPYKSAYAPKEDNSSQVEAQSYRCDVCCKDFNGPQPYNMHMKSKAHKEEVEAQEGYWWEMGCDLGLKRQGKEEAAFVMRSG